MTYALGKWARGGDRFTKRGKKKKEKGGSSHANGGKREIDISHEHKDKTVKIHAF